MRNRAFESTKEPDYSLSHDSKLETKGVHVGVVGTSFKTAPIPVREEFARKIRVEALLNARERIPETDVELVLLSTCNRAEIYFASREVGRVSRELEKLFEHEEFKKGTDFRTYTYTDSKAIAYLFNVASGLDSLVIGEAQILSQVRDAYRSSSESGLCGYVLSKLFLKAYHVGKLMRESYPSLGGRSKNSISTSVTQLISKYCEEHYKSARPNVLLVGSGKMIRLAVNAVDKSRLGSLLVASRRTAPNDIAAENVPLADLNHILVEKKIDIIVTATSSDDYIITSENLSTVVRRRNRNKPLLIIDISVPRNVDPQITKDFGVLLYNIDDLKTLLPEIDEEISEILPSITSAISEKTSEFLAWMDQSSTIEPVLNSLRRKIEAIRLQELENAFQRLPNITPEERKIIEKMSDRIIRRFLDTPSNNLRASAKVSDEQEVSNYASIVSEIFSLDSNEVVTESQISLESSEREIIQAAEEQ